MDYKLDKLRVLSMILVVVVHIANYYCRAYAQIGTLSFFVAILLNSLARISVPVFFMISGALLLKKEYSSKKNVKRITEKIACLVIITSIYLVWDRFVMAKDGTNLLSLIVKPERSMLWFMYVIIGIYIALPFIKRMVDHLTPKEELLFVILWAVFNGLLYFLHLSAAYPIPIINGAYYLGYFVLGHILYKNIHLFEKQRHNALLLIAGLLAVLTIAELSFLLSLYKNTYYDYFLGYRSALMMIASVCAFVFIYLNSENKSNKVLAKLSEVSFGVYLVHGIILDACMKLFPYRSVNAVFGIPVCLVIIFYLSFGIMCIIKKVPVLKRLF